MSVISAVLIANHTTNSAPHPHILYAINVIFENGKVNQVLRRYSEFVALKEQIGSSFPLPPKHSITTSLVPSAWVNNDLIKERKKGFEMFLMHLIHDMGLRGHPDVMRFLTTRLFEPRNILGREMCSKRSVVFTDSTDDLEAPKKPTPHFIVASYYPSWASETNPAEKIDFSKFDIIFFAFVTPNNSAGIAWDDGSQNVLKKLVSSARKSGHNTKIVLSVGGWSGSHWYSQVMATDQNRTKFVKTLVDTVDCYGLDGIDIDWEYPNASGSGNPHSSADAANLLSFFKLLRRTIGSSKVISAAVTQLPWLGEDGKPLKDVSEYSKYMSFVNIMNYDVFSSSAHPGPNAPLGDLCGSTTQPQASATGSLQEWTRAGMPARQLLLGLPLYGYVSKSTDKKLSGSSITMVSPFRRCHPRNTRETRRVTAPLGDLSHMWGKQIPFLQLVESGALARTSEGNYRSANGYTLGWDNCSDTPKFLYDTNRSTVVSFDDTFSIASKTRFARKSGMAGCFTWSLDQDDDMVLHNVILKNLGRHHHPKPESAILIY